MSLSKRQCAGIGVFVHQDGEPVPFVGRACRAESVPPFSNLVRPGHRQGSCQSAGWPGGSPGGGAGPAGFRSLSSFLQDGPSGMNDVVFSKVEQRRLGIVDKDVGIENNRR